MLYSFSLPLFFHPLLFTISLSNIPPFSVEEIRALREAHAQFQVSLAAAQEDFNQLKALDKQIKSFGVGPNPYTWFTMEALEETWKNLQKIIEVRECARARKSVSAMAGALVTTRGARTCVRYALPVSWRVCVWPRWWERERTSPGG